MRCHLCAHHEVPSGDNSDPVEFLNADLRLMLDHLRLVHPDDYEPLEQWPDGGIVLHDDTLEPGDFA